VSYERRHRDAGTVVVGLVILDEAARSTHRDTFAGRKGSEVTEDGVALCHGVVAVHGEARLWLCLERAIGDNGVIVGGFYTHACVRVSKGNYVADGHVVAIGIGACIHAVLAA